MTNDEVRNSLREVAMFGNVIITRHCRKQMSKRNIETDDIMQVLLWGSIDVQEELEPYILKCAVKGIDLEKEDLTVIASLYIADRIVCITVF